MGTKVILKGNHTKIAIVFRQGVTIRPRLPCTSRSSCFSPLGAGVIALATSLAVVMF